MTPIQIILIFLGLLIFLTSYKVLNNKIFYRSIFLGSILIGMILVLNQKILDVISSKLGVGRGVDLIFYIVITVLVYCLIIFYRKLLKQDEMITKIIRNNTISNAKKV